MDNQYRSTFIFISFCLAVLLLIFLPDAGYTISLIIRGSAIAGLVYAIYFYYHYLGLASGNVHHSEQDDSNRIGILSDEIFTQAHYTALQDIIFSMVKSMNNAFESGIYIINPKVQNFELQKSTSSEFLELIDINNTIAIKCIDQKTTATFYQKDHTTPWQDIFAGQNWRGSECVVGQAIRFKDKSVGFILVRSEHFSDIDPNDLMLFEYLGDIVSLFMEELNSLEQSIENNQNKSRLLDLISELNFKQDEPAVLNAFRNLIRSFIDYDCLTISSLNDNHMQANIKLADGIQVHLHSENTFNIHGTLHGLPYNEKKTINEMNWSKKYSNLSRFKPGDTDEHRFDSVLGVPISIENDIWGCIIIERSQSVRFSKDDEALLNLIARILGAAIFWVNEYQKIYQNAIRDGLTGLLNHKTFMERASDEIQRARRFQHHLVFLMYDLDKFKRVNDTLGHPYGDYVIETTAQIMKDNVRTIDVVARYGGEEFAIVLVNTTQEMAMVVAKRIVDNIANHEFSMDGTDIKMTISSGLCEYPKDSEKLSDLISFADQGLYSTKKRGGNGVTIYQDEKGTVGTQKNI